MKELHHQTSEALEGTWDADGGADRDEDSFSGVDVDLQFACLVDWRIEEGKKTLMCNVGSGIADVTIHLAHDADVLIAVQEREFLVARRAARPATATMGRFVGLQAGIRQHDD